MKLFSETDYLNEPGVNEPAKLLSEEEIEGGLLGPRFNKSLVTALKLERSDWESYYDVRKIDLQKLTLFLVRKDKYVDNCQSLLEIFPFAAVCDLETIAHSLDREAMRKAKLLVSTCFFIFPITRGKYDAIRLSSVPRNSNIVMDFYSCSEVLDVFANGEIVTDKVKWDVIERRHLSLNMLLQSRNFRSFMVSKFKEFDNEINSVYEVMA